MSEIAAWVSLAGALTALAAAIIGILNRKSIQNLHVDVDGRMSQLLSAAGQVGEARGIAQERSEARGRSVSEAKDAAEVRALDASEQIPKDHV